METNKAPEKIYLFENPISGDADDRWLYERSDNADIEYTRTDAFIEKACEWLRTCNYTFPYKMIEDFKKAMEEEI